MNSEKYDITIIGGGIAGLSAGYILSKVDVKLVVIESDSEVGGLAKTIVRGDFRFDLGGHRFFTKNRNLEELVKNLMHEEITVAPRRSKIYLNNKYFDYPLKPANALLGMGFATSFKIICDYARQKLKSIVRKPEILSLEDWVVSNFGHKMFNLYFKEYSEKVWGTDCKSISAEWVAQRIKGLSLGVAIKNAFFKSKNREIATLTERFLYPPLGIGRISDRLREEIEKRNKVLLNSTVTKIVHSGTRINYVEVKSEGGTTKVEAEEFISSIPLTKVVKMLQPSPPEEVFEASERLKYRDTIIVAVMVNRDRVTELTWIYIPEKKIPFGRIHEPKNWSVKMAPQGKTSVVAEFFCFESDGIWKKNDKELASVTIENLEKLGFIKNEEVVDYAVVRVKKAYPLLEVGYRKHYGIITEYLRRFRNLQLIGRSGMYRYHNMDHAMETGIKAAENILGRLRFEETNRK